MDINRIPYKPNGAELFHTRQSPTSHDRTWSAPGNSQQHTTTESNYAVFLTEHDRTVVFVATGVRVAPETSGGIPLLAMQIGMDRRNKRISPDQKLSVAYFRQLEYAYEQKGKPDPFRGAVQRAIDFLAEEESTQRLDVNL